MFYVQSFDQIKLIGQTQDDACGEAFDKVAKILGLGYPGGPYLEQIAQGANAKKFKFACSNTKAPLDFSFSGIKTALFYQIKYQKPKNKKETADIAASFQETVIETLINKSFLAVKLKKTHSLILGGGVIANCRLRDKFTAAAKENGVKLYFPQKDLCMDNAAMVAGLGYQLLKLGYRSGLDLAAGSN